MKRRSFVFAIGLAISACTQTTVDTDGSTPPPTPTVDTAATVPTDTDPDGPLDPGLELDPRWRTAPALPSLAAFERLAATGVGGQQSVKFSIIDFFGTPSIEWLDSSFYTLHDEWYWFQLINGRAIRGVDTPPIDPTTLPGFDDVAAVYEWADSNRGRLPLDLRFTSLGRLYSSDFYGQALDDPSTRPLALGSLVRVPARPDPETAERWLLELEYRDEPTPRHIEQYFDVVTGALPAEIADSVLWVPRSREQEITAELMAASGSPYGDRTIRFDDLVVPGATEVYSAGVAAGHLLLVTDDGRYTLTDARPDDIVVVQRTPDVLPPGTALITGTPQTPLAHVNVLALNRGIPNAFLAGLADNPELSQLARVRAPVAVRAVAPDQLDIRPLTDGEFAEWRSRRGTGSVAVPPVDIDALPLTVDLATFSERPIAETDLDALRPEIGGKAAGFIALAAPGTVTMPDRPMAITVRSYFEHVQPLDATIDAMLSSTDFAQSARARFVLLEGPADFAEAYQSTLDGEFLDGFLAQHDGTPLGAIIVAGGLKQMIRDLPIAPDTLDQIAAALRSQFDEFARSQGLRFRSSSSVEDIDGFNGAGLYSSNTGFIDPTVLSDPDDHDRTVERALKRTWSSYWNVEAVEERRYENVDHRSGGMAVLVHARFDDELEVSNGVATFTILPERDADEAVMRLNVQSGDTSVTNPDNEPGQAPEVVELRLAEGAARPTISRVAPSTLVADGVDVLDDEQLLAVWDQLSDVTLAWRDRVNAEASAGRAISTLTLDFEFREMDAAWPARVDGTIAPSARLVVKQARTLEPGLRSVPDEMLELDAPLDVLRRMSRATRTTCPGPSADGPDDVSIKIYTDPLAVVDMGYADEPLRVDVSGSPTRLADESCDHAEIYSSPGDYLIGLFAARAD